MKMCYAIPMDNMFSAVYALVKRIPAGGVASYGGVARQLGDPRLARAVGYAMRACKDEGVPCHRVVRHDGSLAEAFGAAGNGLQRALLVREGVPFLPDGRVDMARCEWRGAEALTNRGS